MNELLIALCGILGSAGSAFIAVVFMKSKYRQEIEKMKIEVLQAKENAKTTEIENDVKLSDHYRKTLDDLNIRYENRFKEFEDIMKRKVQLLEEENRLMARKNKLQAVEIRELKKENAELRHRPPHVTPSLT